MESQSLLERNRVLDAVILFAKQEAAHQANTLAFKQIDWQSADLNRKHYLSIISAYGRTNGLNREEKKTIRFVRHALRKSIAQQSPGVLNAILYNRIVNWLYNSLLGRQQDYSTHYKLLAAYGKSTSLEVNAAVLQQSMKKAGFKNHLEEPLKKMLAHNLPEFSLRYYDSYRPDTDYVLHFKRLSESNAYYFQKFDATYRADLVSIIRNEPSPSTMSFSLIDQVVFNADEARQLVADRPVWKRIAGESVWVIRDDNSIARMNLVHFDLETALNKWPIKELQSNNARLKLINDLKEGKERQITMYLHDNTEETLLISLGPDSDRNNFQIVFRTKDGTIVDAQGLVEGKALAYDLLNKMQQQLISLTNRPKVGQPLTSHF